MATLKQIAGVLGLSPATVSRALNGFPEVGAETRARVVEAARRLDYRPNQVARKLVTGRSGIVGLVARRPAGMAADTTFFPVIAGISAALAAHNVDLVLHVATDEDEVAPYRRLLAKGLLDGFILNAPAPDDRRIAYLEAEGARFVVHGRSRPDAGYPYYDLDNRTVSAMAAELLADLGHRRIALINGPAAHAYAADRLLGFAAALAARGLATPPAFVMEGGLGTTHGYVSALKALGGTLGAVPTAFVCASTEVAAGVYRAVADRGLTIPGDVSVVAHDDDVPGLAAEAFAPPLTVTRSAFTDACAPLADLLIAAIDGRTPADKLQQVARPALLVRASTSPPAGGGGTDW